MGNWDTDANGNVNQYKVLDLLALTGSYSIISRAVVVHNTTDNCVDTSSAGTRLAFGVIGVANVAGNEAAAAPSVATTVAVCDLIATNQTTAITGGRVIFNATSSTTTIVTGEVEGIAETHAIHVHAYGDITGINGDSTGGHYDPFNTGFHAIPDEPIRHAGDMVREVIEFHFNIP
jgi:Cu/Zn superoxide dismutase